MVGLPAPALAPCRAVLSLDIEIVPFTRVLRGEGSKAAAKYRAFRLVAGLTFQRQWAGRPLLGDRDTHLEIDILVTVPVARLWAQDASNLGKGLEDALLGVVLTDDRFVSAIRTTKQPARPIIGLAPGAQMELTWWTTTG